MRIVGEAHDVETGIVGEASMPEHLAHLVDTGLQPEAEENFVVGGKRPSSEQAHDALASRRPRWASSLYAFRSSSRPS